ncbi:MAG: hypothetical protein BWY28_02065 [bacterium ADurb.Bin236]|nr:MAG: hypothetical protein BWY28_02065 [bacterium ADurb.Bin236]
MANGDNQGLFKLSYEAQGVKIAFFPESFNNTSAAFTAAKETLLDKRVDQVDFGAIENALNEKNAEPFVVAPPQPEAVNGKVTAKLNELKDKVLIKIDPPMGRGKKAEIKDVMEAVKTAGAATFFLDLEKIENIISSIRFRDFIEVGEMRHGRFDVNISKDSTQALIKLQPPFGGNPIDKSDILSYLKRNEITTGIMVDAIDKIIKDGLYNQDLVIAKGQRPEDGQDGEIEYFFDINAGKPKPKVDEEGEVDFKELNLFHKCKAGDPLARKKPATPGRPGITIYGAPIAQRAGRDIPTPIGLNTKPAPSDPNLILAAVDGQPKLTSNKVNVIPVVEIPGDVDYSTGNIDFTGSVHVRGSVLSGFTIRAMGDIQIGGSVEICTIECGGNMIVKQGILGQDKALIVCRGNLTAKFIDKATVYADGDIYVDESIMYSKISSSGKVVLSGKKGFIMGGVTRAAKSVSCNQVGTPTQTPTFIEVGGSPTLREELDKMQNEIKDAEKQVEMQSKSLESSEKRKHCSPEQITDEQQQRILLMSRDRFALLAKLRAFKEKKEDLEEKLVRLKSAGLKVHVRKKVMPGVKITIKNASWLAADSLDFATFREYDGEIEFGPYEAEADK